MPRTSLVRLLLIISTFALTTCAAVSVLNGISRTGWLSRENLTTAPGMARTRSHNHTYGPYNFLGVDCYHLQPATVNLEACQPLFAKLFERGKVYEETEVTNGFRALYAYEPCTIMVASPSPRDRRVKISMAHLVVYATDILKACREPSTGGAYTFVGNWQVVVTKDPIKIVFRGGDIAED